jgi:hypothetical protein
MDTFIPYSFFMPQDFCKLAGCNAAKQWAQYVAQYTLKKTA